MMNKKVSHLVIASTVLGVTGIYALKKFQMKRKMEQEREALTDRNIVDVDSKVVPITERDNIIDYSDVESSNRKYIKLR